MHNEEALAVGGNVDRLAQDGDAAKPVRGEVAEALVVVAGDINDACPLACFA